MAEPIPTPKLTLREAAALFGVSRRTLQRRVADGSLPAYRVGPRLIRVTAEDVAALATRIPTADVPPPAAS